MISLLQRYRKDLYLLYVLMWISLRHLSIRREMPQVNLRMTADGKMSNIKTSTFIPLVPTFHNVECHQLRFDYLKAFNPFHNIWLHLFHSSTVFDIFILISILWLTRLPYLEVPASSSNNLFSSVSLAVSEIVISYL